MIVDSAIIYLCFNVVLYYTCIYKLYGRVYGGGATNMVLVV